MILNLDYLRARQRKMGVSESVIAQAAGMSARHLNRVLRSIKTGKPDHRNIALHRVDAIAESLGCDGVDLLQRTRDEQPIGE